MATTNGTYAIGTRNKVQRYRNRATYDYAFIHNTVNTASVVHVAFPPSLSEDADPFPALLPMIGIMARYPGPSDATTPNDDPTEAATENEALDIYLHGYVSSRLMRLATSSNTTSEEEEEETGLPLTVSATHIDGVVLSLTPNSHSYNYRSAVLQGYAQPVTDQPEKLWAMRQITNNILPERWENSRTPPTKTEMTSTNILRVKVVSASGKVRRGGPHDDRHDLRNEEVKSKVWTGVVPIWEMRGEVVPAVGEGKEVPAYVEEARMRENRERMGRAVEAVQEP